MAEKFNPIPEPLKGPLFPISGNEDYVECKRCHCLRRAKELTVGTCHDIEFCARVAAALELGNVRALPKES